MILNFKQRATFSYLVKFTIFSELHLSQVFPLFTFLRCFIFHLFRVFLCCCFCVTLRRFLPHTPSLYLSQYRKCYGFERAILTLRRFLPCTPSRHFGFYQGFLLLPGSRQFFLEGCKVPLRFETQTSPICRFYLCDKDLRNTISNSSRFWTHFLTAMYNVRRMSYPLCHRSS